MSMKVYQAGIDIGSTTVKLVVTDADGHTLFSDYRRHCARTQETLADLLRDVRGRLGSCCLRVGMTGSGALSLADALHVTFEQQPDVAAQCRRHRLYVLAEDEAFAGTRLQVSAQDVDGRRLARTVLAQQPEDTSAGHLEAQVFIDFPFPIVMGQVFAC